MPLMYAALLTSATIAIVLIAILIRRRKIITQMQSGKVVSTATNKNKYTFSFGTQPIKINDLRVTETSLNVVDFLPQKDAINESDRLVGDDRFIVEVVGTGIHANPYGQLQNIKELTFVEKGS